MNTTASQKLSVIEKVGYSLGDLAANLVFQTLVTDRKSTRLNSSHRL